MGQNQKNIDISGDGSSGVSQTRAARQAAENQGITINGLPIGQQSVITFYTDNVKTTDGFVIGASTLSEFEGAVKQKLVREIGDGIVVRSNPVTSVPESSSLLTLGLVGSSLVVLRKVKT